MKKQLLVCVLSLLFVSANALALENIVRPYASVRQEGMGGVKLTTGQYDENFFGNPAQLSQDPVWKFQLLSLSSETTLTTVKNLSSMTGTSGGDSGMIGKVSSTAGDNLHVHETIVLPALYLPNFRGGKTSLAFGLITSIQNDMELRRSFNLDPGTIVDIGPAVTIARSFMSDKLAVGVTARAGYRMTSRSNFSLIDYVKGVSISPLKSGGEGVLVDFDLGGRYELPYKYKDIEFSVGAALNNIMGGKYDDMDVKLIKTGNQARAQPRSFGFGASAKKTALWVFTDSVLALDVYDIGNNTNGSIFRLIHIGGETKWKLLKPRLGINQGYLTAGLGFDFKVLQLDVATYGEEMSLNAGQKEDRRFAVNFGIQI
jgi:hypothetical protein